MNSCSDSVNLLRFLDSELSGEKLETFGAHLQNCPTCTLRVEEERALSTVLHRSRPLYPAPEEVRSHVSKILKQHGAGRAVGIYERPLTLLRPSLINRWLSPPSWGVCVATVLVVGSCLILAPNAVRRAHAASYVETAVGRICSYLEGSLPPEIQSDSPTLVSAWLAGKVPFDFRLPAARDSNLLYRLAGARLVSYGG